MQRHRALMRFGAVVAGASFLCFEPAFADAPNDPRFFGDFCQVEPLRLCKTVAYVIERCVTVDRVRAHIDHFSTSQGGLLNGSATFTIGGDAATAALAGAVLELGSMQAMVAVPGVGRDLANAQLSSDGQELSLLARNKTVRLRKDACGNSPPVVSLAPPPFGTNVPYGSIVMLTGDVTDEDASFPPQRMTMFSNRDGVLTGSRLDFPKRLTLMTSGLSAGDHVITFTATDSGGLGGSATIGVRVLNRAPETPVILQPGEGAAVVATSGVLLEGKAYDPEQGFLGAPVLVGRLGLQVVRKLGDRSLVWSASAAGGPFQELGTGRQLVASFPDPGEVLLRLTATDNLGLTANSPDRRITVLAFGGNAPPRVRIVDPDEGASRSSLALAVPAGELRFLGEADDSEDGSSALALRWEYEAIDPLDAAAPGPHAFGGSSTEAQVRLSPPVDTYYRISFIATDSGGLTAGKSIEILVFTTPID